MKHTYRFYNNMFDLVEMIENESSKHDTMKGVVGESEEYDKEIRDCKVKWLESGSLKLTLMDLFRDANYKSFGFDIDFIPSLQYTIYDGNDSEEGNYYHWHADNNYLTEGLGDRKLSMVVLLSDPHEYEGGEFQLSKNEVDNNGILDGGAPPEFKNKGDVIVFPSFLNHRVTPVTSGVRKSFVAWVEGPKFR